MLTQISSNINCIPSTRVAEHDYKPIKDQPDFRNVTEIILNSSWNTHLNNSKPNMFILQKVKNTVDGFCTHLFFDSAIILTFGDLSFDKISRIIKVNLNWLRVPTADFATKMKNQEG